MVKFKRVLLSILFMFAIYNLSSYTVWATPQDIEKEHKDLEQKVKNIEKQIDKVSIDNVVKTYKESEQSLYEASSRTLTFSSWLVSALVLFSAFKLYRDNSDTKKMKEFMDSSKKEFDTYKDNLKEYQSSVEILENKIKEYESEIDISKSEIKKLKNEVKSYADSAKQFALKSEVQNIKQNLNLTNERDIIRSNIKAKNMKTAISRDIDSYKKIRELEEKARILEESDNSNELNIAINLYTELIKLDKNSESRYNVHISNIYGKLNNYEKAFEHIKLAEEKGDNLSNTLFNKGILYMNMKEYNQAISCFKESLNLKEEEHVYLVLAIAYEKAGNYKEAKNCYKKLGELKRKNIEQLKKDSPELVAVTSE